MRQVKKGITVIELIIVIAIMSLVLTLGFSAFAFSEQRILRQAAAELKSELGSIQRLSLSEGRVYFIVFAKDAPSYTVYYNDVLSLSVKAVKKVTYPKGISLISCNAANNRVTYTTSGTLSGNACTIVLASRNYNIALTANLGAGNISIKDVRPLNSTYTPQELENNY